MFVIENEHLGLRQYTHADDHDMYLCWQDIDTQKGYNGIFDQSFDSFKSHLDRPYSSILLKIEPVNACHTVISISSSYRMPMINDIPLILTRRLEH